MREQANELVIYNFYDFNDEHTSFDNFNIAPCFTDNQRIEFVLDFNRKLSSSFCFVSYFVSKLHYLCQGVSGCLYLSQR